MSDDLRKAVESALARPQCEAEVYRRDSTRGRCRHPASVNGLCRQHARIAAGPARLPRDTDEGEGGKDGAPMLAEKRNAAVDAAAEVVFDLNEAFKAKSAACRLLGED